ncbi:transglycosylase domain-containing protein [Patescibacteria group bacterium]|nr:transglycosylase domain-containing protein [Patescibacteria group bacterium]
MIRREKRPRFLKFLVLRGGFLALGMVGAVALWILTLDIPDFDAFGQRKIIESTKIYDQTGKVLLYDIHSDIQRTIVPFEEIPRNIKNATVTIEDSDFYNHPGIDLSSIVRAFFVNLFSGSIRQGGSTITQQLVKNTLLTPERTLNRKVKEVILAFKVERAFSKEEILSFYLNEIPYGASAYGVAAATEIYFGKKIQDLTLTEAAYLAALPKAPTLYSPYGSNRDQLEKRKNLILKRMRADNFITQKEFEDAKSETVKFITRGNETLKAPHFVFYVREYLAKKYGEDAIEKGGLKVTTTLNWELQQKAEALTKKFIEEEEDKFNVSNAGLVAIDPETGGILTMVGSRDWFADPLPEGCTPGVNCRFEPKVNVTSYALGRQPGSLFKPFVYATAFKKGFTPETSLFDLPTEFNPDCDADVRKQKESPKKITVGENPCYHPVNYDGIFRGPVTLREALAQSINLPSVKTLYLAGLFDSLKTARDLGITTLTDPYRYGLTLVLGGGEVKLLEMVGAYSVFANDGVRNQITSVLKVEDSKGNVLEEYRPSPYQALEPQIARLINDILSDNEARAPAFGEFSYLYFPGRIVAVKTGTTNDFRDAWVIGYVPNFALGVWFGNNDNSSMEKRVAGFIAAPLWNAFFKEALKTLEKKDFFLPEPITVEKPVLRGEWRGEEKAQVHSILYWVDKKDPQGPSPEKPERDPQFALWEYPILEWVKNQNIHIGN